MGKKGAKMTQDSVLTAELLIEKLSVIEGVSAKKMFGGHGLFHEGKMFGIVDSKGKAFIKATDENREQFLAKGSEQHSRMPYYSIPDDVFANSDLLLEWANQGIAVSK